MKILFAFAAILLLADFSVPAQADGEKVPRHAASPPYGSVDSNAADDRTDLEKDFADQDFNLPDDGDLDEDMGRDDRDFFDNDDSDDDSDSDNPQS